ncbi:MAG: hypothetical protein MJY89_06325 [Bacteroidales bacterium]|nr:hypothetical protein [Bacteroidales bacterium]
MATYNDEYASKGVAGAGLGLGIAGTALGLLNNNGNGLLGGLFGNNGWNNGFAGMAGMAAQAAGCAVNDKFSTLEAEIAKLKAEKYSDKSDIEVYKQTREENKDLQDRLLGNWIKPLADEAAANKVVIAGLQKDVAANKEIAELQIKLVEERNRTEHAQMQGAMGMIDQRLRCVEQKVDAITAIRVPNSAVCPGWGPVTITPTAPTVTAPAAA